MGNADVCSCPGLEGTGPKVRCRSGKPLPSLHVAQADWMHPAGNSALEAKEELPKENGNIFSSFSFVTTFFRENPPFRGKGSAENPQRKLEKHLLFSELGGKKKKYEMKTDLIYLLGSCHA